MADTSSTIGRRKEIEPKTLVEAFAEDVSVHGYKVSGFTVNEDLDKKERTLTIKAHVSTGDATQEEMDLNKPRRGRRAAAATSEPENGAGDAA